MNFGGARPEVGKKTASRHEVLARAAADRAERAAARERDTAAVILQSWHRGFAAALLARATQLRAFDARLQSTARLKQQLPSGTQLPLPPLCLLARSLAFVLTGRGSSRINNGSLIMASDGALTGAAAVKLRATLSLLLPTLNSATNIPDVQEPEVNTSPADRKASEAASGVPRTLSRMALLAVRLLAAETISRSEAGEIQRFSPILPLQTSTAVVVKAASHLEKKKRKKVRNSLGSALTIVQRALLRAQQQLQRLPLAIQQRAKGNGVAIYQCPLFLLCSHA